MEGLGNDLNPEEPIVFSMDEEEKEEDSFVHATSEGGDAPQVTCVDDCLVAVAVAEARVSYYIRTQQSYKACILSGLRNDLVTRLAHQFI